MSDNIGTARMRSLTSGFELSLLSKFIAVPNHT